MVQNNDLPELDSTSILTYHHALRASVVAFLGADPDLRLPLRGRLSESIQALKSYLLVRKDELVIRTVPLVEPSPHQELRTRHERNLNKDLKEFADLLRMLVIAEYGDRPSGINLDVNQQNQIQALAKSISNDCIGIIEDIAAVHTSGSYRPTTSLLSILEEGVDDSPLDDEDLDVPDFRENERQISGAPKDLNPDIDWSSEIFNEVFNALGPPPAGSSSNSRNPKIISPGGQR